MAEKGQVTRPAPTASPPAPRPAVEDEPAWHTLTVLDTTPLDVTQWLTCTCVALSVVLISEIRKAVRRRPAAAAG
jgi:hypothetical protein